MFPMSIMVARFCIIAARGRYLARKADEVVRSLKPSDYSFSLGAMIQSYKAEKLEQYFVNVKINFKLKTF